MRVVISPPSFEKKLKKFISAHPESQTLIARVINALLRDPLTRTYKAHKLTGSLRDCHAVSIGQGYRLIYSFDPQYLHLLNIGSHDDVY